MELLFFNNVLLKHVDRISDNTLQVIVINSSSSSDYQQYRQNRFPYLYPSLSLSLPLPLHLLYIFVWYNFYYNGFNITKTVFFFSIFTADLNLFIRGFRIICTSRSNVPSIYFPVRFRSFAAVTRRLYVFISNRIRFAVLRSTTNRAYYKTYYLLLYVLFNLRKFYYYYYPPLGSTIRYTHKILARIKRENTIPIWKDNLWKKKSHSLPFCCRLSFECQKSPNKLYYVHFLIRKDKQICLQINLDLIIHNGFYTWVIFVI